ncbi:MAG: hypothetical protein HUU18_12780 [Phycisphaerales bacterium]|nr:hypothetical protein [Phycisphaerales bacterium]
MTLAYLPFLDPINANDWWFLLIIPLALGISLAYKAVRVLDERTILRQALVMTVQIVLAMIALGFGCYLFVEQVLPRIAPY